MWMKKQHFNIHVSYMPYDNYFAAFMINEKLLLICLYSH